MTARLIEALLLAREWWINRTYCEEAKKGQGCVGCPYNSAKYICDTASTPCVLEVVGSAAAEYFSNLPLDSEDSEQTEQRQPTSDDSH
jgi:hypothetical protein